MSTLLSKLKLSTVPGILAVILFFNLAVTFTLQAMEFQLLRIIKLSLLKPVILLLWLIRPPNSQTSLFGQGKPVHNEVLEDGGQSKLDLTRLIKTFTLDLVTEYNIEVCAFYSFSKNYRRKTEIHAGLAPRELFCTSRSENFLCLFDKATVKHI